MLVRHKQPLGSTGILSLGIGFNNKPVYSLAVLARATVPVRCVKLRPAPKGPRVVSGNALRRFSSEDVFDLQHACDQQARLKVWRHQPDSFYEQEILEADDTMVETTVNRSTVKLLPKML
ncbi:MAG: hypothetical protein O3A00_19105 [Planctomycetota bacterium]|nr:hypothetical protein [Planctomycetota bacterium]